MDDLNRQLASRAEKVIGAADDFQILVTTFQYPIGTLIRQHGAMVADYTGCAPIAPLVTSPAPSLFPSYHLTRSVAAAFDLDDGVLAPIASAGAKLDLKRSIDVEFRNVAGTMLSDHDLKTILAQPSCAAALSDGPYLFVRGYIKGTRTFKIATTGDAGLNAGVIKAGKFDVEGGSDGSVLLTDDGDRGFLVVLSEMKVASPAASPGADQSIVKAAGPAATTVALSPPMPPGQLGKVYVQRDGRDVSGHDAAIKQALAGSGYNVEPLTDAIRDPRKVPQVAQVRYFNDSDLGAANRALAVLRGQYPNAKLVRIGLPSPAGQLEIWLPNVTAVPLRPTNMPPQ